MALFQSLFPLFFIAIIGLSIWNIYEQQRFTRFEGDMQRGVRIWAEPLPWDARQFLEMLPESVRDNGRFIRKQGAEVLVAEERSGWSAFFSSRRNSLRYIGYINLSAPESQIEFRIPWSTLGASGFVIFIGLLFFVPFFTWGPEFPFSLGVWVIPLFFLLIYGGSLAFNHYRERRRLWDILNQAMNRQK